MNTIYDDWLESHTKSDEWRDSSLNWILLIEVFWPNNDRVITANIELMLDEGTRESRFYAAMWRMMLNKLLFNKIEFKQSPNTLSNSSVFSREHTI